MIVTGLSRIAHGDPEALALLRGRRVGLVANQASVTESFVHAIDVIGACGAKLVALFGPEHGLEGEAQDMAAVGESRDRRTGLPVFTLYGDGESSLRPGRESLEGLDALVVDLPDVGSRYYTFVWTAALCLEAAAAAGVQTIVLDRPNPLGGTIVEGTPQEPGYLSFVGLRPVAVRHGLTLGEIATMVARESALPDDALRVVTSRGWTRDATWEACGLPWVAPSPNMPTPDTARVYPGGCLVEGTTLSEGRGTTRPFELWGAPGLDGRALASSFAALDLPGLVLRPVTFRPTFHKHAGRACDGVQVHVTDAGSARTCGAYVVMLALAWRMLRDRDPPAMAWRREAYEFVRDRLAIDLLAGSPRAREAIEAHADPRELLALCDQGVREWDERRRQWFLYGD